MKRIMAVVGAEVRGKGEGGGGRGRERKGRLGGGSGRRQAHPSQPRCILCERVCSLMQQSTASLFSLRSVGSRTVKEDWRGDCGQHKEQSEKCRRRDRSSGHLPDVLMPPSLETIPWRT